MLPERVSVPSEEASPDLKQTSPFHFSQKMLDTCSSNSGYFINCSSHPAIREGQQAHRVNVKTPEA